MYHVKSGIKASMVLGFQRDLQLASPKGPGKQHELCGRALD